MAEHLRYSKNDPAVNPKGNTRNAKSKMTLKGEFGERPIEIPRDRDGSFEPQIVPKHQTWWTGFDDKILFLYARGMSMRVIKAHLEEMYGAEVSPMLISTVTDAVMDEAKDWQSRPLDALYPIVYLVCIHVKSSDAGAVKIKAVCLAMGMQSVPVATTGKLARLFSRMRQVTARIHGSASSLRENVSPLEDAWFMNEPRHRVRGPYL